MTNSKPLTPKQEAFARNYVANGFNATQAAKDAGYSEDSAESKGSQLLRFVKVKERIAELMGKTVAKARKGAEDVYRMAELAAFFDVRKVLTVKGNNVVFSVEDFEDLPEEVAIMIQAIKQKTTMYGTVIEVVFVDKLKALEMLARFNGMNKDQLKVTNEVEKLSDEELEARLKALEDNE